jgi:F-type H+-transporting ATPase subunit epsilon
MADETKVQCVVVTPEKAVIDEAADHVIVPLYDGELGVYPNRLPLIGRLGFGELRLVKGNQTKRFYVDGGFVQIRGNIVTVLTSRAMAAADIKVAAAKEALNSPAKDAHTDEALDAHLKTLDRARAQLRVAEKGSSN